MNRKLDTPLHEKRPSRKLDKGLEKVTKDDRPEGLVGEYVQTVKNNKKSAVIDSGNQDRVPRGGRSACFKYAKTGSLLENTTLIRRIDEIEDELSDPNLPEYRVEELVNELEDMEGQLSLAAQTWGLDESRLVNSIYGRIREDLEDDEFEDRDIDEVSVRIDELAKEFDDELKSDVIEAAGDIIETVAKHDCEAVRESSDAIRFVVDNYDKIIDGEDFAGHESLDALLEEGTEAEIESVARGYGYSGLTGERTDKRDDFDEIADRISELFVHGFDIDAVIAKVSDEYGLPRSEVQEIADLAFA